MYFFHYNEKLKQYPETRIKIQTVVRDKNLITTLIVSFYSLYLTQGSQTRGPPDEFVRPATSLKLLKWLLKLQFFVV